MGIKSIHEIKSVHGNDSKAQTGHTLVHYSQSLLSIHIFHLACDYKFLTQGKWERKKTGWNGGDFMGRKSNKY